MKDISLFAKASVSIIGGVLLLMTYQSWYPSYSADGTADGIWLIERTDGSYTSTEHGWKFVPVGIQKSARFVPNYREIEFEVKEVSKDQMPLRMKVKTWIKVPFDLESETDYDTMNSMSLLESRLKSRMSRTISQNQYAALKSLYIHNCGLFYQCINVLQYDEENIREVLTDLHAEWQGEVAVMELTPSF